MVPTLKMKMEKMAVFSLQTEEKWGKGAKKFPRRTIEEEVEWAGRKRKKDLSFGQVIKIVVYLSCPVF